MTTYNVVDKLDELFRQSARPVRRLEASKPPAEPLPRCYGLGPEDLPIDWRVEWEERAAIMEYCGGMSRGQAEAEALRDTLDRMKAAKKLSKDACHDGN